MASMESTQGPRWSSNLVFVLASAGAAVGLGNLWRFPYIAGENGGGAFVLVYIAAVILIGYPIMVAELTIGRRGRGNAEQAIRAISRESGIDKTWTVTGMFQKAVPIGHWQVIGLLSIFIPFVGIAYYSVIAGWVLDYMVAFIGSGGLNYDDPEGFQQRFEDMMGSPWRLLALHAAFMAGVIFVTAHEIHSGIERAARFLMPALFVLLLILVGFAFMQGDMARGVNFLFAPDFSALTWRGVLLAVGQAFFSLAVGIGALMTFGAYLDKATSLPKAAAQICATDTAVALLAGLAIFPIVFAFGLDPQEGPGLTFVTLPNAFAEMTGGYIVGSAFFLLLFFAAFTTGIATLEPVVSWLIGRGMARKPAALLSGGAAWILGAVAALSFNEWEDVHPLAFLGWDAHIFDILDFSIASLLLPVNGLLIAIFVAWAIRRHAIDDELGGPNAFLSVWRIVLGIAAPIAIVAILAMG